MPRLTDQHKTFIVQRLAVFETPKQVVDALKEEFELNISRQGVRFYDPTAGFEKPAKKWCVLFDATRKAAIEAAAEIGAAHKLIRVRKLDRMIQRAEEKGNYALAASLLEQAAKEMGDVYTNRQKVEHTDPDGNPFAAGVNVFVNGEKVQSVSPVKKSAQPSAA